MADRHESSAGVVALGVTAALLLAALVGVVVYVVVVQSRQAQTMSTLTELAPTVLPLVLAAL